MMKELGLIRTNNDAAVVVMKVVLAGLGSRYDRRPGKH
jgi:hypothetical protein